MSEKQRESLSEKVAALPWHHQIDFGDGILSPGNTKLNVLQAQADLYFKDDVAMGKDVLDIGCWDGFNSFEAKRRGARRVLATDHFAWSDKCWGKRESFELARESLGLDIDVMDIDLDDLSLKTVGMFDLVIFCGVFYHLRHPFLALERLASLCRETFVLETHLDALDVHRPAMVFYPGSELAGDHTNWWGPNTACIVAMMKDVGFVDVEYTQHPLYETRGIFRGTKR